MKLAYKKTVECNSHMKLAYPVTNCFGMVVFAAEEEISDCIKEALLEMGIYQLEVLIYDKETTPGSV